MSNESDVPQPKIGSGHMSAMARQGLRELRAAFYPESNIAQPPVYGMAGELTPSEIRDAREQSPPEVDEEKHPGLEQLRQAENRDDRGRDARDLEKERDDV